MRQSEWGFSVPYRFPVCFTRHAFAPANRVVVDAVCRLEPDRRHRVLVVVDNQVAAAGPHLLRDIAAYCQAFPGHLRLMSDPIVVGGGEAAKNDVTQVLRLIQLMNDAGLDRQSFVMVIGGGAVLDMASFAAAIAHRGIRVVRFPTTVLSQADSGIAVKNGFNLFGKKNFIGTFVPPFAVVNDAAFLDSLDLRDRVAGVVEAIKVALLKDGVFRSNRSRRGADCRRRHRCAGAARAALGRAPPRAYLRQWRPVRAAARWLWRYADTDVEQALLNVVTTESDSYLRVQALWSLTDMGSARALPVVDKAGTDQDQEVARMAAKAGVAIRAREKRDRP